MRGIDAVPDGWSVVPLKTFLRPRAERQNDNLQLLSVYRDHGVVPFGSIEGNHNKPSLDLGNYKTVRKGDLVLNKMKTWQGSLAISDYEGIVSPAYVVCKVSGDWDRRYLHHLLRSPSFVAEYASLSYGIRIGQWDMRFEDFREVLAIRPPLSVQRRIVGYLDSETARIYTLIDRKQRFIDLLHESRAALITHAVTRGLNPSASMKRWSLLGDHTVPAHWELLRAKFILRERDVRSVDGSEELLTVSHITGITRRSEKQVYMFMAQTNEGYKTCRQGDVAINTMWAYQGAAGVAPCNGIVSPSYNVYSFMREVDSRYYDMLLRSRPLIREFDSRSTGIWKSRLRLYPSEFLDIVMPVPPLDEQREIVTSLDADLAKMDRLVDKTRRSIDLLREYRTALISAAVTGQIDIPGTET